MLTNVSRMCRVVSGHRDVAPKQRLLRAATMTEFRQDWQDPFPCALIRRVSAFPSIRPIRMTKC